jgi:hypothetical protein
MAFSTHARGEDNDEEVNFGGQKASTLIPLDVFRAPS